MLNGATIVNAFYVHYHLWLNDLPQVVLLFTCVFYMTSHDDFLERNVGDFLPVSQADQKVHEAPAGNRAYLALFFCP